LRYQPDYLALTGVAPLYAYDLRADAWFQAAYAPIQSFADPRFWGSPVTIYQRRLPRTSLVGAAGDKMPEGAIPLSVDLGQIRLLGAVTAAEVVQPGDVLGLILYWQALGPISKDYTVFVHLLGEHDRVIAQRDAAPGLGALATSRWESGQVVSDPHLLGLPQVAYAPDQAVWEVGLYEVDTGQRLRADDGRDNVRFGRVVVHPASEPLYLDFGPVVLVGYEPDRLALGPGETLCVSLRWQGTGPAAVTVRLVHEGGEVGAQASGDLGREVYHLTLDASAPPGAYDLVVLVTDPADGQVLPLLGPDKQPQGDRLWLTKVRVYP
jgi:hypothetical protein